MPRRKLEETLDHLRAELDQPEALDARSLQLLQQVHDEIETVLELSSEIPRERTDSLRDRLTRAIDDFGASHPGLTRVMGNLVDTLTGLGI